MLLKPVIEDCLLYYKNEKGCALSSYKGRQTRLRHFHTFLTENGYPEPATPDLTTPLIRRYMYSLKGRPRTIRGAMYFISTLTAYATREGYLSVDPMDEITLPKFDAAQRLTVSEEEIRQLLAGCERQRDKRKVALSRALIATLVYSGLRRGELLDLRLDDLIAYKKSLSFV